MKFTFVTILSSVLLPSLVGAFAPLPTTFSHINQQQTTTTELEAATIQFVRGLDEKVVPDIKLTRARDGSSGVATFQFVKYVPDESLDRMVYLIHTATVVFSEQPH
jgi:hypothetical protein